MLVALALPACSGDPVVQDAPPDFTMTNPANSSIGVAGTPVFTWAPSPSATNYTLQVSTDDAFTSFVFNQSGLPGTFFSPAVTLTPGTVYFWQVIADTPSGAVTASGAPFRFTTVSSTPGDFTLTDPADNALAVPTMPTFTWTSSLGAASYRLQIATDSAFTTFILDQSDLVTTSSTPTTILAPSTIYFWRVLAVSTNSVTATNAPFTFATMSAPPPGSFTLLTPTSGAGGVATLPTFTWAASSGADTYHLQVATDPSFTMVVVDQTGITDTTATSMVSLIPFTTYYWRVTAVNTSGSTVASPAPFFFTTG
jgi:hypothetical protein